MPVRVIVPPQPVVSLEDAKGFLRIDHSDDDALLTSLIAAATGSIDGPAGWLGRALGPQTLEATMPSFCGWNFGLPYPPLIGAVEVKYLDQDGVEQTVSDADYRLVGNRVWFGSSYSFPSVACAPDAIRVRYKAGYNGTAGAGAGEVQTGPVPDPILLAINLHVKMHYDPLTEEQQRSYQRAFDALVGPFRIFTL